MGTNGLIPADVALIFQKNVAFEEELLIMKYINDYQKMKKKMIITYKIIYVIYVGSKKVITPN